MKEIEFPKRHHDHPVMYRDIDEAPEDAAAAAKCAIRIITEQDAGMAAIVVAAVGHTDMTTGEIGYSIGYAFHGPKGYMHFQAVMSAIPDLAQDLTAQERLVLAMSILRGGKIDNNIEFSTQLDRDHGGSTDGERHEQRS